MNNKSVFKIKETIKKQKKYRSPGTIHYAGKLRTMLNDQSFNDPTFKKKKK